MNGARRVVSGFTLLELMLALVVITVTAAVSIWAYFARPEVTLDNAARLLARDLHLAQNRASILHTPVSLVFHPDGDGYRVVDGPRNELSLRRGLERIERTYSRDAIFEGVKILPVDLGAQGRIVFRGDGSDSASGRVVLSYRDEIRALELEAGTGRILLSGKSFGRRSEGL